MSHYVPLEALDQYVSARSNDTRNLEYQIWVQSLREATKMRDAAMRGRYTKLDRIIRKNGILAAAYPRKRKAA